MTGLDSVVVRTSLTVAMVAGMLIALERWRPYRRGQRLLRSGWWTDLFWYTLVQSQVLGVAIAVAIDPLARAARGATTGVGSWPIGIQLGFFLVSHDLYIYGFHRLQHRVPWLWRLHEAHHSVEEVDWLAGSRSHPVEILINQTVEFAPIACLGAAPEVVVLKIVIDAAWGMFIHANIDVRLGRLGWIVNGPELHRWHHARTFRGEGMNFGTKLAIWDRLFGTAWLPANKPDSYGIEGPFPAHRGWVRELLGFEYLAQIRHAFRRVGVTES